MVSFALFHSDLLDGAFEYVESDCSVAGYGPAGEVRRIC